MWRIFHNLGVNQNTTLKPTKIPLMFSFILTQKIYILVCSRCWCVFIKYVCMYMYYVHFEFLYIEYQFGKIWFYIISCLVSVIYILHIYYIIVYCIKLDRHHETENHFKLFYLGFCVLLNLLRWWRCIVVNHAAEWCCVLLI